MLKAKLSPKDTRRSQYARHKRRGVSDESGTLVYSGMTYPDDILDGLPKREAAAKLDTRRLSMRDLLLMIL